MAIITHFQRHSKMTFKIHPTQVTGYFGTFGENEKLVLQVDTLGSDNRQEKKKLSQTIQLTRSSAEELYRILGREFGFSS